MVAARLSTVVSCASDGEASAVITASAVATQIVTRAPDA
jgi:hypothetical protein